MTKAQLHTINRAHEKHIKRLLAELDRAHKRFEPFDGFCPAGVDPADTAELMRLRGLIDEFLPFPSRRAEEQGRYDLAIRHAAKLVRRVAR